MLRPAGRGRGIERPDLPPVVGVLHGATGAGTMPVGTLLIALDAAPRLDGVSAGRRDLDEVRAVALVEAEGGLGEPGGVAIDLREVAPDGVGYAIDGLSRDRGLQALAPAHLLHVETTPSPRTERPPPSTASKRT